MRIQNEFQEVVESVELLLLELKVLRSGHLQFLIVHRFREPGTVCAPGEEVMAVYLMHRGSRYLVHLSCSLLLLFEYLAHHSHLPQTISQIFAGIKADPFYKRHGANATAHGRLTRKMGRSCLREYVHRIRVALQRSFRDAGLQLHPSQVLVSRNLLSNQVGYQLKARVDWIHVDLPISADGGIS